MQTPLSRRRFLHTIGLAAFSSLTLGACSKKPLPNILFIAIDDLNDWVGCLGGHPATQTPNLDRLASKGVLFTNAYCAAPACNPSRAALLTGIRPSTSGVYHNNQPWRQSDVLKNSMTLPQYFRAHGYKTMGSGKIFHGRYLDPQSWDYYFPEEKSDRPTDPMPENRPLNGIPNTAHFDWGIVDVEPEEMSDWKVADWVIGQLGEKQNKPFFLACGFFRPHLPWYVPKKYFEKFALDSVTLPNIKQDDLDDVPDAGRQMARIQDHANVLKYDQWRRAVQAYLASIHFVDDCVGRVITALESSIYADNTIIVLWSDHGWHLGEKLHWRKFALWEEATHNVLMFVAPGFTQPGGRCSAPVNLLDIYPTLLDLAGLPVKKENQGSSLLPLLQNPDAAWDKPSLTTHGKDNHTIRSKDWRYIRYADGSEELYDHRNDPMEWTNLAGDPQHANVIADHKKWLPVVNAEESPREP
ncbi:iduronate-2-sulfatase [candidate division KSB1 bacterium]|nr:sulfatase [candidate division KSB1 bacterium]RQW06876.1 MAG: iduronate-2-sulfatase [candidate division KSB1 bacterium]